MAADVADPVQPLLEVYRYELFRAEVREALEAIVSRKAIDFDKTTRLLNGAAAEALSRYVSRDVRSRYGMFFSGAKLALTAAALLKDRLQLGATIADPTCGAGDLLLACLRHAPVPADFDSAINAWGRVVHGLDIHSEVASVTRERVALLAATVTGNYTAGSLGLVRQLERNLPLVRAANYLQEPSFTANADCVVMNPPFVEVDTPDGCKWSSGKVQQAALFVESVVVAAKPAQEIVAILPDVLRSGSRYDRWRTMIGSLAEVVRVEIHGKFDAVADVDVFILHARKRASRVPDGTKWGREASIRPQVDLAWRLGERFTISVGPVVPHRHKNLGTWTPFLDVAAAPKFGEVSASELTRKVRHRGKLHQAPFVVLRRTSSPSDKRRLVHTLITGAMPIAVENHLLVLQPLDGCIESCRALVKALSDGRTNAWLNEEIRCRHLTTRVLKDLPVWCAQ